ncbi:hypothetical protein V2I01_27005 [Micromonospora sp. BRA006-A]|nr:hypothetical protein [Micromonospora sp. BRA006-A]
MLFRVTPHRERRRDGARDGGRREDTESPEADAWRTPARRHAAGRRLRRGGSGGGGASTTSTPAAGPTAATPSASPSRGGPVTIPTSAFVDLPPELRKAAAQPADAADALPELCDKEFRSGGRSVTASAAMMSTYKQPKDPPENVPYGTLHQTVFAFEGTGAADYLRRVRGAVADCRSFQASGGTVTVASRPMAGTGDRPCWSR